MAPRTGLSGRKAQAARNDQIILESARHVFVSDPTAPIAAVAEHAGVGISALYRRYPSKEDLLRKICGDGLETYLGHAEAAAASTDDPWPTFEKFMRDVVDSDTHSITIALAGTFTPSPELYEAATRAGRLNVALVERLHEAGVLRPDISDADLGVLFEQLAAVHTEDEKRTRELRQRYLTLMLDSLRNPPMTTPLPGTGPTAEERARRWQPRTG